jgi:putative serine protease PepD
MTQGDGPWWAPPGRGDSAGAPAPEPAERTQPLAVPADGDTRPLDVQPSGASWGAPAPVDPTWPAPPSSAPPAWVGAAPPAPRERRRLGGGAVAVLVVGCLLLGGASGAIAGGLVDRLTITPVSIPILDDPGEDRPEGSVAAVAAQVLPSTVSIEVSSSSVEGSGSGFVLRQDGLILTNNHVVAEADGGGAIQVVFSDGSQESAEIVGRTVDYDLAVLRVDRDDLVPLPFGDSDAVVVGEPVVAVGAPLGLESTVTTGIVSAVNRPVSAGPADQNAFINAIQTDAAINPGNSGGPLVNMRGEVIGINSAIARNPSSEASGNIGLGFAIPSRQAARTAEQLIETGTATYPIIGVLLDRSYGGEGVKVTEEGEPGQPAITPDGPADQAGIRPGDVITGLDGRPVTEPDQLIVGIRAREPGDTVRLTVRGDGGGGEEREVDVVLDEAESN